MRSAYKSRSEDFAKRKRRRPRWGALVHGLPLVEVRNSRHLSMPSRSSGPNRKWQRGVFVLNSFRFGTSNTYLDSLATQPRMVLSMRKMISTATVSMRIRRSSDNTEQDIGFVGNSLDTAAIIAFCGLGSGFVVTIYDQTGNGEDATQSTQANQPRIYNAGSMQTNIEWDDSNDVMMVSSLTMGSAYCGIYFKGTIASPGGGTTNIMLEMSTNYNNVTQSWVMYTASGLSGGSVAVSSRNSTSVNDFRQHVFAGAGSNQQISVLMDRSTTGTSEIQMWQNGSSLTANPTGTPADQTGTYSAYDLYIGGRISGSLYMPLTMDTLVIYNADSSAIRTSIEAIVA